MRWLAGSNPIEASAHVWTDDPNGLARWKTYRVPTHTSRGSCLSGYGSYSAQAASSSSAWRSGLGRAESGLWLSKKSGVLWENSSVDILNKPSRHRRVCSGARCFRQGHRARRESGPDGMEGLRRPSRSGHLPLCPPEPTVPIGTGIGANPACGQHG